MIRVLRAQGLAGCGPAVLSSKCVEEQRGMACLAPDSGPGRPSGSVGRRWHWHQNRPVGPPLRVGAQQ